jgi:hypothetical protein
MKRWMLSRRTLLRGAGVALALPILEQMMPVARGATAGSPLRFLSVFCANGFIKDAYAPTGTGTTFSLGPSMQSLEPLKDDLLIISGLGKEGNKGGKCFQGATGHENGTGGFLTGIYGDGAAGTLDAGTVSVDQMIANAIGSETKFQSIQTQVLYTYATGRLNEHVSWAGDNTPLDNEQDPKALFDRIFGDYAAPDDAASQAAAAKLGRLEGSILDFVSADATELKGKLGRSDNLKLDEYLSAVRDLEKRLQAGGGSVTDSCNPVAPMATIDPQQTVKNMIDVIVLAMQCDSTRVATLMIENGLGNWVYDFLGVAGGHHDLSHHNGDETMKQGCRTIEKWELDQFAYLLQKMKDVKEADGTSLLDNTMVFLSSDVGDGMGHTAYDLPVILAGKAQGAVTTGRHVNLIGDDGYGFPCSNVPIGNLFISMLGAFGVAVDAVGPFSTGPLAELAG